MYINHRRKRINFNLSELFIIIIWFRGKCYEIPLVHICVVGIFLRTVIILQSIFLPAIAQSHLIVQRQSSFRRVNPL